MKHKAILGILTLLLVVTGAFLAFLLSNPPRSGGNLYTVLTAIPEPEAVPPFQFTNHENAPFSDADLQGDWTLLFFGFTNCPDICPPTLAELRTFVNRLDGQAPTPRVMLVSVDPERDTPAVLKRYVSTFHPDFEGIVGPDSALIALAKYFGIYAEKIPSGTAMNHGTADSSHVDMHAHQGHDAASQDYVINHSGYVLVTDPEGRYAGVFSPPHDAEQMITAWRDFTR